MPAPDYVDFAGLINQDRRQAVEDARTQVLNQRNDQQYAANQAAGQYLAGGDYQGASGALAASGQLQPALAVTQAGQQAKEYQRQQGIIAAKQQEATSYANRDYAGAQSAAALQGDPQGVLAAQQQALQVHQAQQQYLQQAVPVLTAAYQQKGGDGVVQALTALGPELKARGMKDEDVQSLITHAQTDPQGAIGAINATAQIKWSAPVKIGETTYLYNEANPTQKITIGQGPITVKPGERTYYPDSAGGAVGGGGPTPAANGAAPAAVASGGTPIADIPSYLNTVAKIESGGNAKARNPTPGATSAGLYGFTNGTGAHYGLQGSAADNTPEAQTAAATQLTQDNAAALSRAGVTLSGPNLYLAHQQGPTVAAALLKANPNTPAVQVLESVGIAPARALASIQGNLPSNLRGQAASLPASQYVGLWQDTFNAKSGGGASQSAQAVPQPDQSAPPGYHLLGGGGPLFRPASADELKGTGYAAAQIDTATGEIKHGVKTSEATLGDLPPGTGDALLSQLKPGEAAMVKAYAEGKAPIPTAAALRSPQTQRLMQLAAQYDPTFDGVNYPARAATRKDFTSGKSAANVTSFNTAIGHLGELNDSINALGNQDGILGTLNPANAYLQQNIMHNPDFARFEAAKDAVASELVRAFRGTGGSLSEVQGFQQQMDAAKSPAQLRQTIKTFTGLLGSRIDSMTQQYNTGMGTTVDAPPGLTPKAKAILNKLSGESLYGSGVQASSPRAAAPAAAGNVIQYNAQGQRVQ